MFSCPITKKSFPIKHLDTSPNSLKGGGGGKAHFRQTEEQTENEAERSTTRKDSSHSISTPKRRREQYCIIILWKVAQGLVKGYQATFTSSPRRGRHIEVSPLNNAAPASVKKTRESSLKVKGAPLFNIIPRALRDISAGSPEQFKLYQISLQFLEDPELPKQTHCLTKFLCLYHYGPYTSEPTFQAT
jgi:hypothetical protein